MSLNCMYTDCFKRLLHFFKLSSLKRRIVASLTLGFLGCYFLMTVVSYNAIYTMQQNKIKTAMSFDLEQQSTKLTQTYTTLLLISQQMTPQGSVGLMLEEYLNTRDPYNRSVMSRNISSNIAMIAFSNPNVELVMYYNPDDGQTFFANFPLRDGFSLKSLSNLATNMDISYQPPHLSQCRFSSDQVLSVTREVTFSNGQRWVVYIEAKSDAAADINDLSAKASMPYTLALIDQDGQVRYSSGFKDFSFGQKLRLSGQSGIINNYIWSQVPGWYGYNVALLIPMESYNRELHTWKNNMYIILGAALVVMLFISIMLLRLIYKPLRIFESEMDALGKGHMDAMGYRTGINEFDRLFGQFNDMKQQIQQLIYDVELTEKRRHQLEIDKLIYQINPHFLMNALNSVHWMAAMHGQAEISKVISILNLLLSYNLGKSQESATLRTEIKVLNAYLELQHMRYDFEVVLDIVEGEYLDCPVARFILQPIAENAVCHGLDEHGTLKISISPDDKNMLAIIIIQDDGKGLSAEKLSMLMETDRIENQQGNRGIGLRYVHSILESFYGDRAHMFIESTPGQGTRVTIHLPLERGDKYDQSINS